jgi:hypothetical protein
LSAKYKYEAKAMHQMWRLSEPGPRSLGLACTDDGLLLGRTSLIERRDGRFVVRARHEIERLLRCAYDGDPPLDRLMSGLARVASALNADDQCLARIAAVHLQMPDLANPAVRDALAAEDSLIKYARDHGTGTANWNPALHPRGAHGDELSNRTDWFVWLARPRCWRVEDGLTSARHQDEPMQIVQNHSQGAARNPPDKAALPAGRQRSSE